LFVVYPTTIDGNKMDSTTPGVEYLRPDLHFRWPEYIVFGLVLVASLGIGVFYGFFGSKNKTNEEFLMAGRSMSILPVTLSLVCSFVSAITLLGNPVEIYFYGAQYTFIAFSFIPMTLVLMYVLVPVYFRLQLTSAYEYFEWRFSRRVRMVLSVFAIVHLVFYMPTTVYGPSLALDQVANIDRYFSCAAIFIVCIAYSSLGGLKAVLWTDALQAAVMLASLVAIIAAGVSEIDGGWSGIWERSEATNRTNFLVMDPDPRTRHTFWTATVGGFFMWLPLFASTQAQIQRYNSVPTLQKSRLTLLFNMVGLMCIIVLCSWIGMMIYAKYYDCDPVQAGIVRSPDQLLPLFVMEVLGDYPGVPGLLVAGLTCGSLSTVSSALNSLTAIITEDFVKHYRPELSEERLGWISKMISVGSGVIAFVLVFPIAFINESIQISPFSTLLHGSLLGPILGAFALGMFFPWTNELGVLLALVCSVAISMFIGLGNIIAGIDEKLPNQKLPLSIEGCAIVNLTTGATTTTTTEFSNFHSLPSHPAFLDSLYSRSSINTEWKNRDDSIALRIWSLSYIWQPGVGVISTFVLGLIFSGIIVICRKGKGPKINYSLMSEPFLKFWRMCFGQKYLNKWIDYDSPAYSGDPQAKKERIEKLKALNRSSIESDERRVSITADVSIKIPRISGKTLNGTLHADS